MINQLDVIKLEDDEIFHIQMELLDGNTKDFIEKSPNPSALKISKSEKMSAMRHLDVLFNGVDTIIKIMQYCYDNMNGFCLVHTNQMKLKITKGGGRNENNC